MKCTCARFALFPLVFRCSACCSVAALFIEETYTARERYWNQGEMRSIERHQLGSSRSPYRINTCTKLPVHTWKRGKKKNPGYIVMTPRLRALSHAMPKSYTHNWHEHRIAWPGVVYVCDTETKAIWSTWQCNYPSLTSVSDEDVAPKTSAQNWGDIIITLPGNTARA